MTVAPAIAYDRRDWASAFINVDQELTEVPLTAALASWLTPALKLRIRLGGCKWIAWELNAYKATK